jgi:hypothetical protein
MRPERMDTGEGMDMSTRNGYRSGGREFTFIGSIFDICSCLVLPIDDEAEANKAHGRNLVRAPRKKGYVVRNA